MERMLRFVLLYHDCPPAFGKPSHWDLMLERDGALLTWSLAELPPTWCTVGVRSPTDAGAQSINATRIADHRLEYLDYEGPISGGRGAVRRHDWGHYELLGETPADLQVRLHGKRIDAELLLPQKSPA
ncbi:ATP-dependent DNA ligase [Lacipirellula limnantheis]|uniref:ATP-dependent DNA ligase n=2 Tax=Lacipirellula limnantheis TaxID=2528024 RepID=A0A517TVU1_9BACT|nr:ATP-dependent DNA ligase [Lacipirellula limnantheis]